MPIRVIFGLGNPGKRYQHTYHSVGRLFTSFLEEESTSSPIRGLTILSSPVSMNESGKFVAKILAAEKASPEELLVAHDESDLSRGSFKLSFGRGSAGHRGVQSVIASLGTKNFWRLRIGVRKPHENSARRKKAGAFVLGEISPRERRALRDVFQTALKTLIARVLA